MKPFHQPLVQAWEDYVAGRLDAKGLKSVSAGFGIYQQRDNLTMMRIRRVGGFLSSDDLQQIVHLMMRYHVAYAHLTMRQDIQLHGIKAEDVPSVLAACESSRFPFRGGGGDTFRNTLTSSFSGLHPDSVFDILPYAQALSTSFYAFDAAYALPRKLKIAFADRPADGVLAQSNDLGFIAKRVDGQNVFETYVGGGIGFKPRLGLKLFDALPAEKCLMVAKALTHLFNEKGCRTNRAHARIRFLRKDMGDESFLQCLRNYLARQDEESLTISSRALGALPYFPEEEETSDAFKLWQRVALTELSNDCVGVRLFVPFGNFTVDELSAFERVMRDYGASEFEILPSLDLGLVVPRTQVAGLYHVLRQRFPTRDYTASSFVGNIRTCIGCTVCKSGITDAPKIGEEVAHYFDQKRGQLSLSQQIALSKILLNEVRISGCPNSCTCQQLVRFGFSGRKLNGEDAESLYTPGSMNPIQLGTLDGTRPAIARQQFPSFLDACLTPLFNH